MERLRVAASLRHAVSFPRHQYGVLKLPGVTLRYVHMCAGHKHADTGVYGLWGLGCSGMFAHCRPEAYLTMPGGSGQFIT
ncbi:hypothetical protein NDU88_004547 [Pleurodeles waltl]|uniref:Uncharacterized protein n=1 Tax=Pleurodeles waltl TaxID=8319 RepID=A0AAV7SJ42_PLEWA|nr:hypothetical protein NDU88_004547 [Pleurodeles waltl]